MIEKSNGFDDEIHRLLDKVLEDTMKSMSSRDVYPSTRCCKEQALMSRVIDVDNYSTFQRVLSMCRAVFVEVYTPYCPYCLAFRRVLEKVAKEYSGQALFITVNAEELPEIAYEYGVANVPTTLVFIDGRLADSLVGYIPYPYFKNYVEEVLSYIGCLEGRE